MENSVDTNAISNAKKMSRKEENTRCRCIFFLDITIDFLPSTLFDFIAEKFTREHTDLWQRPMRHGDVLLIPARYLSLANLLVVEILNSVIKVTLETTSNDVNGLTKAASLAASACECSNIFLILENILRSGNYEFLKFQLCHERSFLSTGSTAEDIPLQEYCKLEALVAEMGSYRDKLSDLINRTIGENMIDKTETAMNGFLTDQTFLTELNELKFQNKKTVKELQKFKENFTADIGFPRAQNGDDQNIISETSFQSRKDKRIDSLPALLSCISDRLLLVDWQKLREYTSLYLPQRVLENTQNQVEFFNELVNRSLIGNEDMGFLREAFYEIGRVDLVHLIDCVEEGNLSLLSEQHTLGERNVVVPVNEMQDMTFEENRDHPRTQMNRNHLTSSPLTVPDDEDDVILRDNGELRVLRREFNNVPRRSQLSPDDPVQENATENNEIDDEINGVGTGESDECGTNGPVSHVGQAVKADSLRGRNAEGPTTWVENLEVSCEHYDRYFDCKFDCCEMFWPCHRCHNSKSSCSGKKKLRSRDIKKIKCKQCGLIQEFPKNSPHCTKCNLKFAEYFCSICQHLTGTDNRPYHCTKCGICRVHGDRSFHCDVCGVCLDINLQDNHICRAGSAHEECCICFEEAFTGCQILPCSHKVHKECTALMLRNGVTKCPVCRESFAHRIERR